MTSEWEVWNPDKGKWEDFDMFGMGWSQLISTFGNPYARKNRGHPVVWDKQERDWVDAPPGMPQNFYKQLLLFEVR